MPVFELFESVHPWRNAEKVYHPECASYVRDTLKPGRHLEADDSRQAGSGEACEWCERKLGEPADV
jgi:hypothetical protein